MDCKTHYQNSIYGTHTHTVAIGAGRARGRTVHKLLGRRKRYPAYGAGPVREFMDYSTRARARTLRSASCTREASSREHTHTHRGYVYILGAARRPSIYFE